MNNNQKINTLVNLDINKINLSKYVLGYNKESFVYEIFGICNHSGNCFGGHYYSYIKNNNNNEIISLISFSTFSSSEVSLEISNKARAYLSDVSVEKDLFALIFNYQNLL